MENITFINTKHILFYMFLLFKYTWTDNICWVHFKQLLHFKILILEKIAIDEDCADLPGHIFRLV